MNSLVLLVLMLYGAGALVFMVDFLSQRGQGIISNPSSQLVFYALIWPVALIFSAELFQYVEHARRPGSEPMAKWKRKAPKVNYNEMAFGAEKDGAEDMAAFIKSLESRPDAPLPDALTFSYKPTGISRTYPKGTMFPSALVGDWKRGFYMGLGEETGEA